MSFNTSNPINEPSLSTELVNAVMSKYASVTITTKYYVTTEEDQQIKIDLLQGTDFKSIVQTNQFTPFNQLVAKGIIIYDDLIDYMEEQNEVFKTSEESTIAPFTNIFSYCTDANDNIIIQTRDFAEIPSSVGGGIGCSYRQDTEMIYDSECKLTKWQTSLGVYSATPKGTLQQGYILEIEFDWTIKE